MAAQGRVVVVVVVEVVVVVDVLGGVSASTIVTCTVPDAVWFASSVTS